jgi:hypothetical protein
LQHEGRAANFSFAIIVDGQRALSGGQNRTLGARVWISNPCEGFRFGIVFDDEAIDNRLQIDNRDKDNAFPSPLREFAKKPYPPKNMKRHLLGRPHLLLMC